MTLFALSYIVLFVAVCLLFVDLIFCLLFSIQRYSCNSPYMALFTGTFSLRLPFHSNIILVWKDKRLRRINLGKQLNQQNSFSLRNILKTSLTQCNLFLIFFLFYMPSFCVKFCSSTCPLLWLVLFRCIHLIDLLYWCCTYLSILQYILIIYGMTQNIPTWKRLWPQRHLTLFSY